MQSLLKSTIRHLDRYVLPLQAALAVYGQVLRGVEVNFQDGYGGCRHVIYNPTPYPRTKIVQSEGGNKRQLEMMIG